MQTAVLGLAVTGLLGGRPAQAAPPPPESAATEVRACLALIHDGRFAEAEEQAQRMRERRAEDPAAAFLYAFVAWWRLLYDDKNETIAAILEARLQEAAAVADAAGEGRAAGVDHRVWNGYSHILLAEVHANRREVLAAARKAKEGRKYLADSLAADATSPEPCFGLGTYNYYADQLSALAKGLRFLLGLPSGDRETGLRQLEFAADRSDIFGLESRLLLATIYASRRERDYVSSIRELGKALTPAGSPVVALDAASRLDLALGDTDRAIARLDEALRRATSPPAASDPSVVAALRLNRARADFAAFRLETALRQARALTDPGVTLPERVRRESNSLVETCLRLTGRAVPPAAAPPKRGEPANRGVQAEVWERLSAAVHGSQDAGGPGPVVPLRQLAQEMPANPVVAMFLGRALLASGSPLDALPLLERAARSPELPREWIGPTRLAAGNAADLLGDRPKALSHYREAAKAPAFVENAAPYFYQRVPYAGLGGATQQAASPRSAR